MQTRTACTSILIGKSASADGSIMIGRNEDSKAAWPKHVVKHPESFDQAQFKSVVTGLSLDLPAHALAYTATPEWTKEFGLYEEAGINSAGVAMSATESAYANSRVLGYDPFVTTGIIEEAMVTVVLPYVTSAKEGVMRLGQIVTEYGSGEANGILFADHEEAWYMEIATGHHWVAQRIPDDSYAVVANQLAIQTVDPSQSDFLFDADLFDFAQTHHLWQPGTPFVFREIFGTSTDFDRIYNTPRVWDGQRQLSPSRASQPTDNDLPFILRPDKPLHLDDATAILASHYQETPYDPTGTSEAAHRFRPISLAKTQESHVLQLRPDLPQAIADIHWIAMGVAAESQFVPFFAGTTDTPAAYKTGTLPAKMDSAYWQYKLAGVLIDAHFNGFKKQLQAVQGGVHAQLLALIDKVDQESIGLDTKGLADLATKGTLEAAAISAQAWQAFTMDLLTQSTDLSPLNFKTDLNL
ncbi:C69 family dipeptidase [Lacticaseibacillus brantae]|uniref:Dipeptidase n=1 Tax=Lacticaseibacillus brantae DSM 23927 TaxID=1423727 RepID=A0A0R2B1Q7_9LACO|nr:C69 family dipeptidase [Lacticaseibacillus brantae]KRM72690.1 U34 family dipeptidase D [Lacticaseibacillus brantae DSM 23927]